MQELNRLPAPLQQVMRRILDPNPNSVPLSKLISEGEKCIPGKGHDVQCIFLVCHTHHPMND